MFERYSEAARRSIFFARFEAGRLGFDEIDTPHLLLGLLQENAGGEDAIFHQLLSSNGEDRISTPRKHPVKAQWPFLSAGNVTQLLTRFSTPGPRSVPLPTHGDMPLSNRAKRALTSAFEHAGDRTVMTLDLLWAMLSDDQQEVAESISAIGVTREQIEQEIRRSHD